MTNYLRNRPFMVINYTFVPKAGQNTSAVNFGETAEYDPVESMVIVDRVDNKRLTRAYLVLDLFEGKVIKSREGDVDFSKIFHIMCERYKNEIKQALRDWVKRDPKNQERVNQFIETVKSLQEPKDES